MRAGWTALAIAAVFTSAVLLVAVPRPMLLVFTFEPQVLRTGAVLLAIAAAFQLLDGRPRSFHCAELPVPCSKTPIVALR